MQALTDRPLRLVGSLFWFVCAVLLLVRGRGAECVGRRGERGVGGLWARFPRVSSSTSTVVFWLSQSGKTLDSALGACGGVGLRGGGVRIGTAGCLSAGRDRGWRSSSEASHPFGLVRPRVFPAVAGLAPLAAPMIDVAFVGN